MATFPSCNSLGRRAGRAPRRRRTAQALIGALIWALAAACLLAGCGEEPSTQAGSKAAGAMPPASASWKLVASYLDAGPGGPALLALGLIPTGPEAATAQLPEQDWAQALTITPAGGSAVTQGVRLARGPEPGAPPRLVYALSPPARPQPGASFTARLEVRGQTLAAGPFTAQSAPKEQMDALLLRARAARMLGQGQEMVTAGQELTRLFPQSPAGPYYQGLGREAQGDLAGAIKAFEQALTAIQARKARPQDEPPAALLRRVSLLRRALAQQERTANPTAKPK